MGHQYLLKYIFRPRINEIVAKVMHDFTLKLLYIGNMSFWGKKREWLGQILFPFRISAMFKIHIKWSLTVSTGGNTLEFLFIIQGNFQSKVTPK